ncbi:MAG: hypothetical protein HZB29_03205 [Nitrospinae bacterium]|nr:hypothetical protein [Nitrospinota bacterium]
MDSAGPTGGSAIYMDSATLSSDSGTFDIPSGAIMVHLVGNGGPGARMVELTALTGPDGVNWPASNATIFSNEPRSTLSSAIPYSDTPATVAGTWNYTMGCSGCSIQNRWVFWKSTPGSTLKVNVILVSQTDIADPQTDATLQNMLANFARIYANAGITVSYKYTVIDSADTIVADTDSDGNGQYDAMDRLFAQTGGYGPNAEDYAHLVFVNAIGSGGGTLGISGGIPGPPVAGTPHSGVILSTFGGLTKMSADMLRIAAETAAHELGHFLGLFHPSESDGKTYDPISDTPECHAGEKPSPANCPDGTNLMFWISGDGVTQETLTAGQKGVLQRAILVR